MLNNIPKVTSGSQEQGACQLKQTSPYSPGTAKIPQVSAHKPWMHVYSSSSQANPAARWEMLIPN